MVLTLYIDQMSQPSRAVWIFCMENNIPVKIQNIQIAKGETRSAEYKAKNPHGKVPVIDDDGFVLWESHTILRYLHQTRKTSDHWYPAEAKPRAIVDRYLDWHHTNIRTGCAGYTFAKDVFGMLMLMQRKHSLHYVCVAIAEQCEKDAVKYEKTLKPALKFVDMILSKNKYIAGANISIADLLCVEEIIMLYLIPYDMTPYPNIVRYIKQVQSDLKTWDKAHGTFDKVCAKRKVALTNLLERICRISDKAFIRYLAWKQNQPSYNVRNTCEIVKKTI